MMEAATNPVNRTGTRKPELLTKDEQVVGAQSPDFHGKIGNPWEAVTFQPAKNHPQPTDLKGKIGAPGRIRTCDRRFRRPVLYPAELRAHEGKNRMGRRLYSRDMVGVEGFEPPTSCSQSRRATRLRYTPNDAAARMVRSRLVGRQCGEGVELVWLVRARGFHQSFLQGTSIYSRCKDWMAGLV